MPTRQRVRRALIALPLLLGASLHAQRTPPPPITEAEIGAHLRFLSSDLLEGRAPGTRGEALTTAYLIAQLQAAGLQPGANGAWLQEVRLLTHDPIPDAVPEVRVSGAITRTLAHGRDLRLTNQAARDEVVAGGDLVFIGYGISAPVYGWDDLAGIDIRGKVVIARMGEPASDTTRFNGVRASRFGWLRSKQRELERRGATGVLWLARSGTRLDGPVGGARRLARDGEAATLLFSGAIADSTLAALLPAGVRLDTLLDATERPGFHPLPLGSRIDVRLRTRPHIVTSHNVVATVPGTDPARRDEHVVLSAHWDAFGIGAPVNGDSIRNGALDDASGTAALLALARVFRAQPQPRSITFLFTTAEEWGLLGAQGFVDAGPIPLSRIAANLNLDDGVELFGRKKDVASLGVELSSLGDVSASVARSMSLRVTPDPSPEEGFFLRQDGFTFAEAGVPSLYMALGMDAEGRPAGWTDARVNEYMARHYHQPSDEYDTVVVDLAGAVQYAAYVRAVTTAVATARARPAWRKGAEFSRP